MAEQQKKKSATVSRRFPLNRWLIHAEWEKHWEIKTVDRLIDEWEEEGVAAVLDADDDGGDGWWWSSVCGGVSILLFREAYLIVLVIIIMGRSFPQIGSREIMEKWAII